MEIRDVHGLLGGTAYAADGERLGTITGVYLDNATGRPSWLTVEAGGLFSRSRRFVPLDDAEAVDGGVRAAVDADAVKRAPQVDEDRELTPADELELARHYALGPSGAASGQQEAAAGQQEAAAGQEEAAAPPGPAPAADPGQPTLTRSEEQVRVDTATVPTSRAVLRTTRVVEERTFSVPLGRDQVQVVYEPLPDAGPGPVRAQSPDAPPQDRPGPEGDDDDWVVLYEERLVVRTEWVPVERVRLRTAGVRGEEVVHVDLRRERVDVDVEPTGQAPGGEPDEARP